jgi:type VI protein secretion system component VasF
VTQGSRTTEARNHDYEAIRDIMTQIRERLTMPDRATLAVGLVGHLATMMNRHQAEKLIAQLAEEMERVQDVPPHRKVTDAREAAAEG